MPIDQQNKYKCRVEVVPTTECNKGGMRKTTSGVRAQKCLGQKTQ